MDIVNADHPCLAEFSDENLGRNLALAMLGIPVGLALLGLLALVANALGWHGVQ